MTSRRYINLAVLDSEGKATSTQLWTDRYDDAIDLMNLWIRRGMSGGYGSIVAAVIADTATKQSVVYLIEGTSATAQS